LFSFAKQWNRERGKEKEIERGRRKKEEREIRREGGEQGG
jgi:hypothetical protein